MSGMTSAGARDLRVMIAGERFGYPHGMGAAARVAAYARGLADSGASVHVMSLLTPDPGGSRANQVAAGVHDGVRFQYACGTRVRATSFLGRRWLEVKVPLGLWRTAARFFGAGSGPKAIIAYTTAPAWITLIALVAKARGALCLVEVCEMPLVYERSRVKQAIDRWLLDNVAYRLVDGFIAISTELERYVDDHAPGAPCLRVPILVISSDFDVKPVAGAPAPRRQVMYSGDLSHEGEVADLLLAFALVARSRPDVVLTLLGGAGGALRAHISDRAAQLGLRERVSFAGHVARARLPEALGSATVLVLLRRDAAFSRAGLPTKLAEYLASGRPVVVTATGDIPLYLTHGVDAYLSAPGDPERFAEQLGHVLDHEEEAREVGARGRLTALRRFDHRLHGERLGAYIADLHRQAGGSDSEGPASTGPDRNGPAGNDRG